MLAVLQQISDIVAPLLKVAIWNLETNLDVQGLSFWLLGGFGMIAVVLAATVKFPKDQRLSHHHHTEEPLLNDDTMGSSGLDDVPVATYSDENFATHDPAASKQGEATGLRDVAS